MDIKQLQYYVTLYQTKHFSHAAKDLFITQQALSKSIQKLEEELGPLIIRNRTSFTPTPLGDVLYTEAVQLLDVFQGMQQRIRAVQTQNHPCLHLVTPFCVREYVLNRLVTAYCADHSPLEIDWTELSDVEVEQAVLRPEFDFGFSIGLPLHPELYHIALLARRPLCLMIHKNHPLSAFPSLDLTRDVPPSLICCADERFKISHMIRSVYEKAGIPADFQQVNDPYSAYSLALKGQCASISFQDVLEATAYRELNPVPIVQTSLSWDIYLLIPRDRVLSPIATSFSEYLKQAR